MTLTSLAGKRIAITRPRVQSFELANELSNHGALPLVIPLIEITEPSDEGFTFAHCGGSHEWFCLSEIGRAHV